MLSSAGAPDHGARVVSDVARCLDPGADDSLDSDASPQWALTRCRALLGLGRHEAALRMLDEHGPAMHGDAALTGCVLRAIALVRMGSIEDALALLHAVRAHWASASPQVRSEASLALALAHYRRKDFAAVESALADVEPADGGRYARTFMYRGYVALQRGDYRDAVRAFTRALDLLEQSGAPDLRLEQDLVRTMSVIAAELADANLWADVERRAERRGLFAAGVHSRRYGFEWARSIRCETAGRPGDALRAARESAFAAPTAQLRIASLCQRATILLRYGERLAFTDDAVAIRDGFRALEPQSVKIWDHALIPLAVAEVLATVGDVKNAVAALNVELGNAVAADAWALPIEAYRSHVQGLVADAKGEAFRARHCYRRAFAAYAELGFANRAMAMALSMPVAGRDTAMLGYVQRHARALPADSWIARRCAALGRACEDTVLATLSKSDRHVLALLAEGRSTTEVATLRNRTPQTIRNTISRLNHVFGVDNRHALLRECARRKVFEPD